MTELELDLLKLIEYWRSIAEQAEHKIDGLYNLRAQGHMSGLSTAYNKAATSLEDILAKEAVRKNKRS